MFLNFFFVFEEREREEREEREREERGEREERDRKICPSRDWEKRPS